MMNVDNHSSISAYILQHIQNRQANICVECEYEPECIAVLVHVRP